MLMKKDDSVNSRKHISDKNEICFQISELELSFFQVHNASYCNNFFLNT
jgi:hypothetical protein